MLTIALTALTLSTLSGCPSTCGGADKEMPALQQASFVEAAAEGIAVERNIVETAIAAGSFDILVEAVKAAELVDVLTGEDEFTVFAPTDEAFRALEKAKPGTLAKLMDPANKELLKSILTYHVVEGSVMASDVVGLKTATTVQGQRVDIAVKGDKVKLDKATVVKTDIKCSNGVIHVIDEVIMPETRSIAEVAKDAGSFNTLLAAVEAAGLTSTLSEGEDLTVFAPTDDAFAALPAGTVKTLLLPENLSQLTAILTDHIVKGKVYADKVVTLDSAKVLSGKTLTINVTDGRVMIGNATVVTTDVEAANGVIHVISAVILPSK